MPHEEDPQRTRIARAVAAAALFALLAISLLGFTILGSTAPGVVAEQTGFAAGSGGQLQVHGERLSATVFGDRFVFSLRAASGQVSPAAFPATFPLYPGGVIERSAVYQDGKRTLRAATYRLPAGADPGVATRWYRTALEAEGYRVTAGDDGGLDAVRGGRLVRIQPASTVPTSEPATGTPAGIALGVYLSEG
jgi:hypothetical protein